MKHITSFKKTELKDIKSRLQMIKEIHRRKVIEQVSGFEKEKEKEKSLNVVECFTCGTEFVANYPRAKFCVSCRKIHTSPVYAQRAKEWFTELQTHFKEQPFIKEEVNVYFGNKYSLETVRKVLNHMVQYEGLNLISGGYKHANKYHF